MASVPIKICSLEASQQSIMELPVILGWRGSCSRRCSDLHREGQVRGWVSKAQGQAGCCLMQDWPLEFGLGCWTGME